MTRIYDRKRQRWMDYVDPVSIYEMLTNKVTGLSGASTDDQYPSAKCVYDALATKLDISAFSQNFKGLYIDLPALQAAHPSGVAGDYAQVDAGVGANPVTYVWDASDGAWVAIAAEGSGAANTDALPEGATNLYFTAPRAIAAALTGFVVGAGTVSATDSILQAIQKIVGNLSAWRVPSGGSKGQVLMKTADTDNSVGWQALTITFLAQNYSEYATPTVIGVKELSAGTYAAPKAYIGSGSGQYAATLEIRQADATVLCAIGGVSGGMAWRTADHGFTLTNTETVEFIAYSNSNNDMAIVHSLTNI